MRQTRLLLLFIGAGTLIAILAIVSQGRFSQKNAEPTPAQNPPTATPGLNIAPANQDLGKVIWGEVAETSFTITNTTNQPVNITRVSTSCGCTKASLKKEVLAPGESVNLQVSFDPAVHDDDSDLGNVTRTIYIETNHPIYNRLESTITAEVVQSNP